MRVEYADKFMDYEYDAWGQRKGLVVKEGSATGNILLNYGYTYNKLEQLVSMEIPGGAIKFEYYPTGRLYRKVYPHGMTALYEYYANGDMKAINYRKYDGDSLLSLTYSLDNAHNITAKTQDGVNYTYGYDELYQLTSVTKAGALKKLRPIYNIKW